MKKFATTDAFEVLYSPKRPNWKSVSVLLISLIVLVQLLWNLDSAFLPGGHALHNPPTTNLLPEDSLRYACNPSLAWDAPYAQWRDRDPPASDQDLMCAAHRRTMLPPAPGRPRIAFLFLTRGELPLEPLWRQFFAGREASFSLYVHASDPDFRFPNASLFHEREIPSQSVARFGISFNEAVRRLVAHAILDHDAANAWFTVIGETTIPLRPFPFVYDYIMRSRLSFVEAFISKMGGRRVFIDPTKSALGMDRLRKGEPWVTLHRRHAGLLVGDYVIFPKFKENWNVEGLASEHYFPTLFSEADPQGIANRTLMYVKWSGMNHSSHPESWNATGLSEALIRGIQSQTSNSDGFYNDSRPNGRARPGVGNQASCVYNGVPNSLCYLFARKFATSPPDVEAMMRIGPSAIGL